MRWPLWVIWLIVSFFFFTNIIGLSSLSRRAVLSQIADGQVQNVGQPGAQDIGAQGVGAQDIGAQDIGAGQVQSAGPFSAAAAAPEQSAQLQQIPDGQVQQIADGQPQLLAQQIANGQVQQIPNGQPQVQQIPNGQLQVQQIPNGQLQVQQIPNGQLQVLQIPDGQLQVPCPLQNIQSLAAPVAYGAPAAAARISFSAKAFAGPAGYSYPAAAPPAYQAASYAPADIGVLSQLTDGQVQGAGIYSTFPAPAVAPPAAAPEAMAAAAPVEAPQAQAAAAPVQELSQITDGQVQNVNAGVAPAAPEAAPVASEAASYAPAAASTLQQATDGQPQNIAAISPQDIGAASAPAPAEQSSQVPAGPVQDAGALSAQDVGAASAPEQSVGQLSQIADGQVQNAPFAQDVGTFSQTNLARRQAPGSTGRKPLTVYLDNGILKDSQGRQGYIADNFQFQFDAPPQATAYVTSGFSVCPDGTISLRGSNIFYQCPSGDCMVPI